MNGRSVLSLARAGGEDDIRLSIADTVGRARTWCRRKVILGIRPEAMTDRDGADRNASIGRGGRLRMVEVVEPAGSDTFVVTHIARQGSDGPHARRCGGEGGHAHAVRLQP